MDYFGPGYESFAEALEDCRCCPRQCGVNRLKGERGYCGAGSAFSISSVCVHRGEEPALGGEKGVCNVFFSYCNLSCTYCQNHQISCRTNPVSRDYSLSEAADKIITLLNQGITTVGFVSPSHMAPHVFAIVEYLHDRNFHPVTVWNSNGYDSPKTIREADPFIDIYLPDYKYSSPALSSELSDAPDYPQTVYSALKEMIYQKGAKLLLDADGTAYRGIVVRHLVLPGYIDNSRDVIKTLATDFSTKITLSLMAQYFPQKNTASHKTLNRKLRKEEYELVAEYLLKCGIENGWIQEIESPDSYNPDFTKDHPFE